MKKSLFQGGIRCLGTFLLIGYFSPAAPAIQVQLSQAITPTQSQCSPQNNSAAENKIQELLMKAGEYITYKKNDKALATLSQALQLVPTLKSPEVKASLVQTIVNSFDANISLLDQTVKQYVAVGQKEQVSGVLSQVLQVTQTLNTSYSNIKTRALTGIARHYATIGQTQKTLEILPQALQAANSLQGADFKTIALSEIAQTYVAVGQNEPVAAILSQSLEFAKAIKSPIAYRKVQALQPIAVTYAKIGQYNQALQVAQLIEDTNSYRASALSAIAKEYVKNGQPEQALQIAQTLTNPPLKATTLTAIAAEYAKKGQQDKAAQLFSQALQAAESVATIAIEYAEAGQPDAALQVVPKINDASAQATTLYRSWASESSC